MMENLVDMELVLGMAGAITFILAMLVQFSEYTKNNKDDDKKVKFAFVPYFLIPLVAVAFSAFCGAIVADYAVMEQYVAGSTAEVGVAIIASLAVYAILDKYALSDFEDATYIRAYRDKFLATVTNTVEETVSQKDLDKLQEILKILKK